MFPWQDIIVLDYISTIVSLARYNWKKSTQFFPLIKAAAEDDRNFVKKAVNWALRQIGKRSNNLNKEAIKWAKDIGSIDSKSASWIANDALRELKSPKVKERFN